LTKVIGLFAGTFVVAAFMWLSQIGFSDGDLSAQEGRGIRSFFSRKGKSAEQAPPRSTNTPAPRSTAGKYDQMAHRYMAMARERLAQGDRTGARSLADTARKMNVQWQPSEQTPKAFLAKLDGRSVTPANPTAPATPRFNIASPTTPSNPSRFAPASGLSDRNDFPPSKGSTTSLTSYETPTLDNSPAAVDFD